MNRQCMTPKDTAFMAVALDHARRALDEEDFPVGCVIADDANVVAHGRRTGTAAAMTNELDHAEINALRSLHHCAPGFDGSRLSIYCTMEPCLMCFSAILLSGISRIVYAYEDVMGGGTACDRSGMTPLYRDTEMTVVAGVLREKSLALFQRFFRRPGNDYWADSLLSRYTLAQESGR
jgi:tRNA(adenine34) deaminase